MASAKSAATEAPKTSTPTAAPERPPAPPKPQSSLGRAAAIDRRLNEIGVCVKTLEKHIEAFDELPNSSPSRAKYSRRVLRFTVRLIWLAGLINPRTWTRKTWRFVTNLEASCHRLNNMHVGWQHGQLPQNVARSLSNGVVDGIHFFTSPPPEPQSRTVHIETYSQLRSQGVGYDQMSLILEIPKHEIVKFHSMDPHEVDKLIGERVEERPSVCDGWPRERPSTEQLQICAETLVASGAIEETEANFAEGEE